MSLLHPFPTAPSGHHSVEVAPGVHWVRLPLPMVLNHVNCYALDDGDGWTLVDTGMASDHTRALWQALMDGPLGAKPVTRLIVTHHHPDHIGLAGWFQSRGVDLLTTRTAWVYARMLTLDTQSLPTPEALLFDQRAGVDAATRAAKAVKRPFNFSDVVAPMPLGFTGIAEGDVLTAGGRRWLVRLGQGHAPDHAMLWSLDDDLIIGGDQLLPSISANIGVYPTEPTANPLEDWLSSTRRMMPLARDTHFVLPGHKLPFRGLPHRLDEMLAENEATLDRLLHLLKHPHRATDCFGVLFKRPIDAGNFSMALAESVAHLNCLLGRGTVTRHMDADGAWVWQATQAQPIR